jgi:hypothetical protein
MAIHKNLTGDEAIHPAAYITSSDPGAVGADKLWIDTTTDPPVLKRRNSADDGWIDVIDPSSIAASPASVSSQTASYTLVLGDANTWVRMNVASANNLTVPANSSVAFPVGTEIHVEQKGAGQTTVVADTGVTVNTSETLKLEGQYAVATLKKVATDEWTLIGYLEAAA